MADHHSTRQLKRAELTKASTPTISKRPRLDALEEWSECVSESPVLLLPSSDSLEKINVLLASGANSHPSASSTSLIGNNYHVFLSFRGRDTRKGFVDHLYQRLKAVGLRFHPNFVFRDDNDLPFGEEIAANLISAIKHSKVSIPIISENYAASEWCLSELIQIMECVERGEQKVLPVLYKVKPYEVRELEGAFGKAFKSRMHRFNEDVKQQGPEAIRKAVATRIFESEEFANGHEGELVEELVQIIIRELQHDLPPALPGDLVGIDDRVAEVMKLVDTHPFETQIIGIYGIGVIGKTTLATIIYKKLFCKFKYRSFLKDTRETIKSKGMEHAQSLLISDITESAAFMVRDPDTGIGRIQSSCKEKKVLILLDDVDHRNHLDKLIGSCTFGPGSRIIVTCRDKALLKHEYEKYELEEMNSKDSLLMFSRYAFEGDQPPTELAAISGDIVATTGELPLALVVIGSYLKRKDKSIWVETLDKLRKIPDTEVQKKLKISYDALKYKEKQMFLDIACFFIGIDKRIATYMWTDLQLYPNSGLARIIELSLIKYDEENKLRMHDQLKDLGRAIARPEGTQPWDCSRLWDEEAMKVLPLKDENRNIEALSLDEKGSSEFMEQSSFKRMPYLKFIRLSKVKFVGNFKDSLSELIWLECEDCPNYFTATNVHLEKLLVLDLSWGFISEIWGGWSSIKLGKLKVLNLSRCSKLKSTPDLSGFEILEMLILKNCRNLEKIDPSIGDVKCLVSLDLSGCRSLKGWSSIKMEMEKLKVLNLSRCRCLKTIPNLSALKSLERLNLEGCVKLEEIDPSIGDVKCLVSLNLRGCASLQKLPDPQLGKLENLEELLVEWTRIKEFPKCIKSLKKLKMLSAAHCHLLTRVPPQLGELKGLVSLNLRGCRKLEVLPEEMCELEELKALIISETAIKKLPPYIGCVKNLEMLDAFHCKSLDGLPESIRSLVKLEWLTEMDLSESGIAELPESIGDLKNLKILKIARCMKLKTLPSTIRKLGKLEDFDASSCENLEGIIHIDGMSSLRILQLLCTHISGFPDALSKLSRLEKLDLSYCRWLESLPQSISNLHSLQHLELSRCSELQLLPELPCCLQYLSVYDCYELQLLPELPPCLTVLHITSKQSTLPELSHLTHLKELSVRGCPLLKFLPELPSGLLKLHVARCDKLEQLPSLSSLGSLSALFLQWCIELTKIDGLEALKYLATLDVSGCPKLPNLDGLEHLVSLRLLKIEFLESDAPLLNDDLVQVRLDRLKNLENLYIWSCQSLRKLDLPQSTHLKVLSIRGCRNLVKIRGLESLTNLESLDIDGCASIETLPDLSCFHKLEYFSCRSCSKLHDVEGLEKVARVHRG